MFSLFCFSSFSVEAPLLLFHRLCNLVFEYIYIAYMCSGRKSITLFHTLPFMSGQKFSVLERKGPNLGIKI